MPKVIAGKIRISILVKKSLAHCKPLRIKRTFSKIEKYKKPAQDVLKRFVRSQRGGIWELFQSKGLQRSQYPQPNQQS